MAATMRDVAKKAGVSIGTVSRYLNGYTLRKKNHIKIEKAIKELDFKVNLIAKGLKTNRSMTIGVLIGDLTDIFATSIVTVIEKIIERENYSIIICDYEGDSSKLAQKIKFLLERSVDGIVLYAGTYYHDVLNELEECMASKTPIIVVNDDIPELNTDKVLVDNANASFRAVEQLVHLNHKDIAAIIGPRELYTSNERYKGYQQALQAYDIPIQNNWVKSGNFSTAGGYMAAKELMQCTELPTALYITNYYMTLGAVMALNELNIRIPEELSIIGFDHFELSDVIQPRLTVVEQPTERMGQVTAELILKRMKGDYADFPQKHFIHTKMLLRDSIKKI